MKMIVLVNGLPGSGKTRLADMIAANLGAARLNADYVRTYIDPHLGFSHEDRIAHARIMGHLSNALVTGSQQVVVTDFVNPTEDTNTAFHAATNFPVYRVMLSTMKESRFADTNQLWNPAATQNEYRTTTDTSALLNLADAITAKVNSILRASLKRYYIRFNTAVNEDPTIPLKWRIIDADAPTYTERLASSFHISGSHIMSGRSFDAQGVEKWNVELRAALLWEGDHANFVSY